MYTYIYIYIYMQETKGASQCRQEDHLGFSNGTLERRYSRIMLPPPQNMKPYLGHWGSIMRAYCLLRVLLCFLTT